MRSGASRPGSADSTASNETSSTSNSLLRALTKGASAACHACGATTQKRGLAASRRAMLNSPAMATSMLGFRGSVSDADVFVPQLRTSADESAHQLHARRIVRDRDFDAARTHVGLGTLEGAVLADDHARNLVEQDRAAAHVARREGRVDRRARVLARLEPARVLQ